MMADDSFVPLETERLTLRRLCERDAAALAAYRSDPEVARFQSWSVFGESEAEALVEDQKGLRPGVPGRWFQFAIELKAAGALVGDCGLKVEEHDPRQAEIGFTLSRAHQGRGYASEAVSAVLDYAFGRLRLHRVTAVTDCENAASVALLERLGMRREGHLNVWFKGGWGDEFLYAILAEEWDGVRRDLRGGR